MANKQYTTKKVWNEKYKGVYGIFDSQTGDALYIGSSIALNRRINRHKTNIKNLDYVKQWHPSDIKLYSLLASHSGVFFQILDECEKAIIRKLEKFYIKVYQPKYNINDRD
jgi:predicted GIY-YIG superfamily endonuclease